jgi:hypothetical protein
VPFVDVSTRYPSTEPGFIAGAPIATPSEVADARDTEIAGALGTGTHTGWTVVLEVRLYDPEIAVNAPCVVAHPRKACPAFTMFPVLPSRETSPLPVFAAGAVPESAPVVAYVSV